MKNNDRNYGVDLVRILAVILVLIVHFFLNTKYYDTPIVGSSMIVQSVIKNFALICVPLFILITGFLNNKLEYNKSFFKSLLNILIVWFFYSIIEYFTISIMKGNLDRLSIRNLIYYITSFKACNYSWYIEMYIGLYLISPIINNAYNSFNKKNKFYLLLVVIFITIIPSFANKIFSKIIYIPNWWYKLYPVTYYICGKYIADSKPNFKKKTLLILLILTQIFTYSYSRIAGIEYYSLTTFVSVIIIFLVFYNINIKNNLLKNIIKYISNISLDIYLASSLLDRILYPIFNQKMLDMGINQQHSILYAPIILITVFILSLIYGSIRKLIINVR